LEDKKTYINEITENITLYSDYEWDQLEYKALEKAISENSISLLTIDNSIKDLDNKKQQSQRDLDNAIELLQQYSKQETIISENEEIKSRISSIKTEITALKQKEHHIDKEYTELQVKNSLLLKEISECESALANISVYQRQSQLYKYYLESIHRDGIPHSLISQTLPQIEEEMNNILSQIVDFRVLLVTDNKNINGYIAYSSDRYWSIELVSGMEKFITSLAIRCALIGVSSLPRPDFILIDEGFGSLDKENLGSVISLFDYMKTQFKFTTIISHIENMRDMMDSIIEITKKDGVSKIQHG